MRPRCLLFVLLVVPLAAQAADLKVKVVDPRSAVVAGAQVALYPDASSKALGLESSSAEGTVSFAGLEPGEYRVEVLAPGFAPAKVAVRVPQQTSAEVQLTVAGPQQTVVVTATRTPVPVEESGAAVSGLDRQQLDSMRPSPATMRCAFFPEPWSIPRDSAAAWHRCSCAAATPPTTKSSWMACPSTSPAAHSILATSRCPGGSAGVSARRQSTLYGSDAMTSVLEMWTRTGSTRVPELRFGADGGTFCTAQWLRLRGWRARHLRLQPVRRPGKHRGQGVNNAYSNSCEGANVGAALSKRVALRIRFRHSNSFTGFRESGISTASRCCRRNQ